VTTDDLYIRDRLRKQYLANHPLFIRTDKEKALAKAERARRKEEKKLHPGVPSLHKKKESPA